MLQVQFSCFFNLGVLSCAVVRIKCPDSWKSPCHTTSPEKWVLHHPRPQQGNCKHFYSMQSYGKDTGLLHLALCDNEQTKYICNFASGSEQKCWYKEKNMVWSVKDFSHHPEEKVQLYYYLLLFSFSQSFFLQLFLLPIFYCFLYRISTDIYWSKLRYGEKPFIKIWNEACTRLAVFNQKHGGEPCRSTITVWSGWTFAHPQGTEHQWFQWLLLC